MIEIDGSKGGGQIVRSAVGLAALTGRAVRIEEVRGARPDPGLKRQHRAAVRLAADVCDADVEGIDPGSETVAFAPGPIEPGSYAVDIETAGSATLVFDTLLPLAAAIDAPLSLAVGGGTDVKWSPSMDFYRSVKLPLLREHGVVAAVDVERRGFYPEGGGRATLHLAPSSPAPVRLTDRGDLRAVRAYSVATDDLADAEVATRQADAAVETLLGAAADDSANSPGGDSLPDVDGSAPIVERTVSSVAAPSTGSVLVLRADYERCLTGHTALGEPGKPAEDVGTEAAERLLATADTGAAVDRHLADQLLVFLAIAGGEVWIPEVTAHVASSVELLDAFGVGVDLETASDPPRVIVTGPLETDR